MTNQTKLGDISNLIADMTMKGASNEELTKIVRYIMSVIDGNDTEDDDYIHELKEKYQID